MNLSKIYPKIRWRVLLVVWRLICLVSPKKIYSFKLNGDLLFEYPLKTDIGQALFIGSFENFEAKFIRDTLQQGNTVFDIGANAGFFTLIAAKKVGPAGHVYAFEPGVYELQLLRHNLKINHLDNVTIVDCAVSDKVGTAQFAISNDGAMNSLAQTKHPSQKIKEWREVKVITLDYFVEQQGIKHVDFMKIDVEGAEKKVLQGATNFLTRLDAPMILCEFCDVTALGFQSSGRELWDAFVDLGFQMWAIANSANGESKLVGSPRKASYTYENLIAQKKSQNSKFPLT